MSETHGKHGGAGIDLDAMTVPELTAHIAKAQALLKKKQEYAATELLAKWKAEAAAHNLSFDALFPGGQAPTARKRSGTGDKLPVKYKGPGGEEWSGRGKLPQWLADAEKQGRKRDEFLVRK